MCRDAVGSYAENQRITAVRKVFQRGVINPMINIEALWKDYGLYENVRLKQSGIITNVTLLHSERPKLYAVLAFLSATGLSKLYKLHVTE